MPFSRDAGGGEVKTTHYIIYGAALPFFSVL